MAVNLKALSATELQALIQDASAHLDGARKNLVKDVRAKIDSILKESGLSLDDVYHRRAAKQTKGGKSTLKGSTVAPKYRNPENPADVWTGRGRQPAWVVAALKKRGVTKEDLLIGGEKTKATTKKAPKKVAKKAVKKTVRKKARA
ncbi:H-NS family nucleoid-associated regulatory protein [Dyella sp. 20L07]|uniref:H-NS histone family protein n=1 Tax=Dyella sp. 20L07 TaxID=3384240 RepID=UPI003D2DB68E